MVTGTIFKFWLSRRSGRCSIMIVQWYYKTLQWVIKPGQDGHSKWLTSLRKWWVIKLVTMSAAVAAQSLSILNLKLLSGTTVHVFKFQVRDILSGVERTGPPDGGQASVVRHRPGGGRAPGELGADRATRPAKLLEPRACRFWSKEGPRRTCLG